LNYDEEIAGLKKTVSSLNGAIGEVIKAVTQNWTNQSKVNRSVFKAVKAISVRVAKSEASREEMRKMVSEISKGMQLQEGTIKEIEGFKPREQG